MVQRATTRIAVCVLTGLLLPIAASSGVSLEHEAAERVVAAGEPVERTMERKVVKEVDVPVAVEKIDDVVRDVPADEVVKVLEEVPVEKIVEVVKEVPVEKIVEVVKEVPVEKVVERKVAGDDVGVRRTSPASHPGRELARHTYEGQVYTLVEYGDELAVFSSSGSPVSMSRLADDVLRSYAWGRTLDGMDTGDLASAAAVVRRMGDNIAGARNASSELVGMLDLLEALRVNVPILGQVSAMDVIVESHPAAAIALEAIRSLDDELDLLGSSADVLVGSVERIVSAHPSAVSGGEVDALFERSVMASRRIETSVRVARSKAADIRNMAGALKEAIRYASETYGVGQDIGEYSETVARYESELSGIVDALQSYENTLAGLAGRFQAIREAADRTHEAYVARWLQRPYDANWRDGAATQTGAVATRLTPVQSGAQESSPNGLQPFRLGWSTSASSGASGESFTLRVRMYGVREPGEHGGISVSFPWLKRAGGSDSGHSSSLATVEVLDYTTGLSKVTFHQPGATIYHKENDRRFSAVHLLVESDDGSWPTTADRTLVLRITPKRPGEFPMWIRGWLCRDGYTDCARSPTGGAATDQQGYYVQVATIAVSASTK